MDTKVPYILSLAYKDQINESCKNLANLGFRYFVMYIVFNDGRRFVLSNIYQLLIPYYTEGLYKEDFSFKSEIIAEGDYLCDRTKSVTDHFKDLLETQFGVHRAYYITRSCPECTFVFGAIKDKKFGDFQKVYEATIRGFEVFCSNFVDAFIEIIKAYNPNYKNSYVLTNRQFRRSVITGRQQEVLQLTEREQECLLWISMGKTTKEIAKILLLSPSTVEVHTKHIREKLNCSTMIEAVIEAINRGIFCRFYKDFDNGIQIPVSAKTTIIPGDISNSNLEIINKIF